MTASCLYRGHVRHRRFGPVEHTFTYPLFLLYLDLDEVDHVLGKSWLSSASRPAPLRFRRRDFPGDARRPVAEVIRDLAGERTGRRPSGPVRVLTHLRTFGLLFNPVRFYYCFESDGALAAIVAEVHNTPWGEVHEYVLAPDGGHGAGPLRFAHEKTLHVSPFMDMGSTYEWSFNLPGDRLVVHVGTTRPGEASAFFDATLDLERREIDSLALLGALLRYPCMTGQVLAAIYFEAFRLWRKRTPFFAHPKHRAAAVPEEPPACE